MVGDSVCFCSLLREVKPHCVVRSCHWKPLIAKLYKKAISKLRESSKSKTQNEASWCVIFRPKP